MNLEKMGAEYAKLNEEARDLMTYLNQNNINEFTIKEETGQHMISQETLETGFILVKRDPEHPLQGTETHYGIKDILRDIPTTRNYSTSVARTFFNSLREDLGMNEKEVEGSGDGSQVISEEVGDFVSVGEWLEPLAGYLEEEFSGRIDTDQLTDDLRSSLTYFGIEIADSTYTNPELSTLVRQIGGIYETQDDNGKIYADKVIREIAGLAGYSFPG